MTLKADHVVLVHGYAAASDSHWMPWMHEQLEAQGIRITAISMPHPLKPNFAAWMRRGSAIVDALTPTTVVVAHSLGAPFLLRLLSRKSKVKVRAIILVSPLFAALVSVKPLLAFFSDHIDWKTLRQKAEMFGVVHAKNDPLVPFDHGLRYAEVLDARLLLLAKGGHFNARKEPVLLKEILKYL